MSVLILGATSPIARAVAHTYAQAGYGDFYLAARQVEEAQDIASDLSVRYEIRAHAGEFHATHLTEHARLIDDVERTVGPIEVAILAFGAMGDQQQSEDDFTQAHKIIETNYSGAASICETLSQLMAPRRSGSIIVLSSVAGDRGRQSNYIYGSAKGALSLYLQGLRNRLYAQQVQVLTIKLGWIDTPMTYGLKSALPIASPQAAAQAIYKAHKSGENEIYYPPFWKGVLEILMK